MDLKSLLFSLDGRIGRQKYIGSVLLASLAGFVASFIVSFVVSLITTLLFGRNAGAVAGMVASAPFVLAGWWAGVALAVKRVHDRDRSGWFMLVCLIPLVGLWFIVETLFLKGTDGTNRFGADPLA